LFVQTLHHFISSLKIFSVGFLVISSLEANPQIQKSGRIDSVKELDSKTSRFALSQTEEQRSFCSSLFHQAYDSCCKSQSGCHETEQEHACNGEANTIHESCLSGSQRPSNTFY
jgi:hypothetical protein